MKNLLIILSILVLTTSCVSKKKYVELETQYNDTRSELQKTTIEKDDLEAKFAKIEKRVDDYNSKINSLKDLNSNLESQNSNLTIENANKLDLVDNSIVMSKSMKENLKATLAKVDPNELANAKTLRDSIDLAVAYNLKKSIDTNELDNNDDVDVNIDKTVVMISVSDKMLFNSASYKVKKSAYKLIEQLANVINSEPSMDVMIEGHTDNVPIHNDVVQDNWDLSVKRATSIIRILEKKYNVEGKRLIASGRGSAMPLVENDSRENRARNRRTRIVILPNLDKFFALMSENEPVKP